MAQVPKFGYNCDACEEGIGPDQLRVHCLECENHDLCMICHSTGKISKQSWHKSSHSNEVIGSPSPEFQNLQSTSKPPAHTPTLESERSRYWGTLRNPDGSASPMFARLCTAIFNHFDATVDPENTNLMEPSKVAAAEEAMGLFDTWNIVREPQNAMLKAGGTIDEADELIKVSWTAREMAHVMTTRQSETPILHGMPALTMESFSALHMMKLSSDPGAYCGDINNLLKQIPELVDPVTGKSFEHKIPLICFPPGPVPEVMATMRRISEALSPACDAWCHRWNERKKQEMEHREALAMMALQHQQALEMQHMRIMQDQHDRHMLAMKNIYQFPTWAKNYIR